MEEPDEIAKQSQFLANGREEQKKFEQLVEKLGVTKAQTLL